MMLNPSYLHLSAVQYAVFEVVVVLYRYSLQNYDTCELKIGDIYRCPVS